MMVDIDITSCYYGYSELTALQCYIFIFKRMTLIYAQECLVPKSSCSQPQISPLHSLAFGTVIALWLRAYLLALGFFLANQKIFFIEPLQHGKLGIRRGSVNKLNLPHPESGKNTFAVNCLYVKPHSGRLGNINPLKADCSPIFRVDEH